MVFKPKFETIVDLYKEATKQFANRELFGSKVDGHWKWITYGDFATQVDNFRGGLDSLGLQRGDKVAIISNNNLKWAIASFACTSLGLVFVPMYEAQSDKDWEFILRDCEAKLLIVSTDEVYRKCRDYPDQLPAMKHVLHMNASRAEPHAFDYLLAKGSSKPVATINPSPSDTAFLIYTSGTTGNPKGVILSHKNIASNVSAIHEVFDLAKEDRSLSFLPWAHVFGLTCELHGMLSLGASMAINSAVEKLIEELSETSPTVLISVPRIFNRIYDGVNKQMASKPQPIQKLFKAGLRIAAQRRNDQPVSIAESVTYALANRLVFAKIKMKFGGHLRYAISGGAALALEVAEFIDSLGITVYEGYGLTETSPILTANFPNNRRIGSVGKPVPGCRIAIDRDATDDPKHGEIIGYGPNIMTGYHNRPEENLAVMLPDGGFRTGDMGYVDSDGFLHITGRIKEQYKLENGKYVVPAPLEEKLNLSPLIANVYIHGHNRAHNVALVVPDFDALKKWAKESGLDDQSKEQLARHPKIIELLRTELETRSADFKGYEKVQNFAIITDDFTTANGMLTASMKLKRRTVVDKYAKLIDSLYR